MKKRYLRRALVCMAASTPAALGAFACSSDTAEPRAAGGDGAAARTTDASASGDAGPTAAFDAAGNADATSSGDAADGGSTANGEVTFSYRPSWAGVTAVSLYGQFGTTTDWTAPFLTLAADGAGGFAASAALPAGSYPYFFKTVGDAAGVDGGAGVVHDAVDPGNSAITPCPAASPTYAAGEVNPCSLLVVPLASSTVFHVRGTVTDQGSPAAGWLVQIERMETGYHHFYVDRTTVGSDGTFDLAVAAGGYQLFVEYPSILAVSDADQKPDQVGTYRREVSTGFPVSADVTIEPPSVGYSGYAAMTPRGDAGDLPTTFHFVSSPLGTTLAVYSGKADSVGDPWFVSAATHDGGAIFDGGFDTAQAGGASLVLGARYFWGIDDALASVPVADGGVDGGLRWSAQSLVFPVTFR